MSWWREIKDKWNARKVGYAAPQTYQEWFASNIDRIRALFEDEQLTTLVYGDLKKAFEEVSADTDSQVRASISQVAIANAVIAGLPGRLGVGVFVSMALEAWMAFRIGSKVGVDIKGPTDIYHYLGLFAGIIATIIWGFVHILRFVFSLIVWIPGVPATFVAELIVTNFIGVLFWVGFEETKLNGSFTIPKRMFGQARRRTFELYRYQYRVIEQLLSKASRKDTLIAVGQKAKAWLTGDFALPSNSELRGEVFFVGAVAALIQRDHQQLDGPLGQIFLQSIRDRWSTELADAPADEIASFMETYSPEQMVGVMSVIKGKMFEHMVALHENQDQDDWIAHLHDDESFPGSDIVFSNVETGEQIEVSLKAVSDEHFVEAALLKYPEIPIIVTSEVGEIVDDPRVASHTISNATLVDASEEFMSSLTAASDRSQAVLGVAAGTAAATVIQLWPITVAHLRGRISREDLDAAYIRILGKQGVKLAGRVALAGVLGPIYAWYLLARGVMKITPEYDEDTEIFLTGEQANNRRLEYRPRMAFTA
jgi:hypothetical protein